MTIKWFIQLWLWYINSIYKKFMVVTYICIIVTAVFFSETDFTSFFNLRKRRERRNE